ncbi:MAG: apocarotenoid-15,15'-oxygenase [Burkholderiaceae bacterium]|nr:MAG: apocarotenoid-15,15'-oxygenase [Burkholderiaceae bacterium]
MNRRHFFHLAGAAAAAKMFTHSSLAQAQTTSGMQSQINLGATSSGFQHNPRLTPIRGYRGQDVSCESAYIEGKIPNSLRGHFYRNGPGLFERKGQRYQHWFDGDGMVHAWRFTDKGVSHQSRFVGTSKFIAEQDAGEFLVPAFGTAIKPKMPVRSSDSMNTANTSVIKMNDRLYALWEGGSAHALDPISLATEGIVSWTPELTGMPFSAHPKVEPDGTMWNFGTMMGKLVLYQFSPQGKLVQHHVMNAPSSAMVHDFVTSQGYLIFLFSPIHLDMKSVQNGVSMVQAMQWKAQEATKLLVIDKTDFSKTYLMELPAMMLFHFGNAWDDGQKIRLDFVKSKDMGNFQSMMPKMMLGQDVTGDPSSPAFLEIDVKKQRVSMTERTEILEFPRVDPRVVGRRNRYVFYPYASDSSQYNALNGVMRLDVESGKVDRFHFGERMRLEEHVVVPKAGSSKEGEAWLVGVGFDIQEQSSFASVFDAQNLAAGPVALARLPYWTPHCFHGNFYTS